MEFSVKRQSVSVRFPFHGHIFRNWSKSTGGWAGAERGWAGAERGWVISF